MLHPPDVAEFDDWCSRLPIYLKDKVIVEYKRLQSRSSPPLSNLIQFSELTVVLLVSIKKSIRVFARQEAPTETITSFQTVVPRGGRLTGKYFFLQPYTRSFGDSEVLLVSENQFLIFCGIFIISHLVPCFPLSVLLSRRVVKLESSYKI